MGSLLSTGLSCFRISCEVLPRLLSDPDSPDHHLEGLQSSCPLSIHMRVPTESQVHCDDMVLLSLTDPCFSPTGWWKLQNCYCAHSLLTTDCADFLCILHIAHLVPEHMLYPASAVLRGLLCHCYHCPVQTTQGCIISTRDTLCDRPTSLKWAPTLRCNYCSVALS